jgi:hypothetical protein
MSGSSLSTFLTMFEQFLCELKDTFPSFKKISSYHTKFDLLRKTNPKSILTLFMEHTSPYSEAIMEKNESFIIDGSVKWVVDLQLKELWLSDEMTPVTKDAIWAHLSSLYFFANTISNIPEGLMNNIENLAKQYASEMDVGSTMDPTQLMKSMSSMQSMLGNMNMK